MSRKDYNIRIKKLKRLRRLYWLVGVLSSALTLAIMVFFLLIFLNNNSTKPTAQEPETVTSITENTLVIVEEICTFCLSKNENQQLISQIKSQGSMTQPALKFYLKGLGYDEDVIKIFSSDKVLITLSKEKCEVCLDESIYMVISDTEGILFYKGNPLIAEKLPESINEKVIIMDPSMEKKLKEGIRLEDYNLYMGIFRGTVLGVYANKPSEIKPPLFIFPNLVVKADLIYLLNEEPPFNTMEKMLDLIESYTR
ncbi:hypothetical protein [Anaerobranca gottschalkii]|uniref:Uncharacterized protein n=1 Tax=Anaerobranca gottschalkii DSM 13577 TaxID=1120990 RepID=A0A1I0BIE0_9FIRM|nr:hypothetical protein [Anaerobranca gottschalkii]SET06331.1 hypothetical protein SAMN03080614_10407 [Anaerobranca gottschalkii DSM 13577]